MAEDHEPAAESGFKPEAGLFREMGALFYLAVTQLEHAEWLIAQDRSEEASALINEARVTFERLQARPWLKRTDRLRPYLFDSREWSPAAGD